MIFIHSFTIFEFFLKLKIVVNKGNIVVDVGNSLIKSAKFVNDELSDKHVWEDLRALKASYPQSGFRWIFSSVRGKDDEIAAIFHDTNYLLLTSKTPIPIELDYDTPETLGMDRLAAAVGAFHLFPNKTSLVIDAGSCITYELMDAGVYRGGLIAPGLKMRMKAMHHFTSRLPDISNEWQNFSFRSLGKSTRECLVSGAYGGMIHEMNGFIEQYLKDYENLTVILTGGDATFFESKLKAPIFANLNLVLIGLNRILNHNK